MTEVRHLGDFGTPVETSPEVVVFRYFGEEIRVNPDLSELDFVDFMDDASKVDENDSQSWGVMKNFIRAGIHSEDFDRFWGAAKRNKQGLDDLMKVIIKITEQITERPTERPADSSVGPSNTVRTSRADSYSRVLDRLDGRPDLQEMVVQRREALHVVSA